MTSDEIVSLATSLRAAGVSRFSLGDLTVEFVPPAELAEPELRDTLVPLSPMEEAAQMLSNRGRGRAA